MTDTARTDDRARGGKSRVHPSYRKEGSGEPPAPIYGPAPQSKFEPPRPLPNIATDDRERARDPRDAR